MAQKGTVNLGVSGVEVDRCLYLHSGKPRRILLLVHDVSGNNVIFTQYRCVLVEQHATQFALFTAVLKKFKGFKKNNCLYRTGEKKF